MSAVLRSHWGRCALVVGVAAALLIVSMTVGASGAQAAKSPIVIGNTCDCSGSTSSSTVGWTPALQVWQKWINAKGGINGHRVELINKDTKTLPTAALAANKELLSNKKVVALIPGSGQGVVVSRLWAGSGVPIVGGLNVDPTWGSNKNVFAVGTTAAAFAKVLAAVGARVSKNKNAANFYCAEVASCKQSAPLFAAGVKAKGGKVLYTASISASAPNYTAQCLAAKGQKAGYIWVAHGASIISRVATDCAKNDYKPVWAIPNYDVSFTKVPALNGAQFSFPDALFTSKAASQFQAAVSRYDPGLRKKPGYGQYSYAAWLSGQAVAKAIANAKPKGSSVTRPDVYRGLYRFRNETLGGGAPGLTFTKGKAPTVKCGFAGTLRNGKLVAVPGTVC